MITQLELGGAQQNTLHTVAHLDRARFDVALAAGPGGLLDDEARAIADLRFETLPALARPIRPSADLCALGETVRFLRELRPDLIHTHSSKAGVVGRLAAAIAGVPIVVHSVHGWGFHPHQKGSLHKTLVAAERLAAGATTKFVSVSHANVRQGIALGIAEEEDFEVIHSGVHLDRFREAEGNGRLRAELGLARDTPLVAMVACLKPQKDPLAFVEVAARVVREVPDVTFVLAGDGVLREEVEARIEAHRLGERVKLLGWRRDPETIVGDCDVLLLTSLHEGLPRVVPEAMAAGKPVVATAVDGTPEAVAHGETGYVHKPGDAEALAQEVTRLLRDDALRARFGEAARERAGVWDIDEMVRRQEELYVRLAREAGIHGLASGVGTHGAKDRGDGLPGAAAPAGAESTRRVSLATGS